jgi:hypothetical protein
MLSAFKVIVRGSSFACTSSELENIRNTTLMAVPTCIFRSCYCKNIICLPEREEITQVKITSKFIRTAILETKVWHSNKHRSVSLCL